VFHFANAWEDPDGKTITVVGSRLPFFSFDRNWVNEYGRLHEWKLDLEVSHI
jgi:hypothetical protein